MKLPGAVRRAKNRRRFVGEKRVEFPFEVESARIKERSRFENENAVERRVEPVGDSRSNRL